MTVQHTEAKNHADSSRIDLLRELGQIDSILQESGDWISALQRRKEAIRVALDIPLPARELPKQATKTIAKGLEYRGVMMSHLHSIDIYVATLRRLWIDFPERRNKMAQAMALHGRTRRYVATEMQDLFVGQPFEFARKYSRALVDDWYVDINHSEASMRRLLPKAIRAAGLTWNEDVKIFWRRTQIM
jgi:hypothetical protein